MWDKAAGELLSFLFWLLCAVWIDENVLVEVAIVEVLKHHGTSLEGLLLLLLYSLVVLPGGQASLDFLASLLIFPNLDALLQEDGRRNLGVREQFTEVFQLGHSLELGLHVLLVIDGLHVRVALALLDGMADLLAAEAALLLQVLLRAVVLLVIVFVIGLVLHLVLLNLAAFLVLADLGAAPPIECLGVVRPAVRVATPVEV